jgi:hypothetical protein
MRRPSGGNDMSRDEIGTLFAARFVSKISARTLSMTNILDGDRGVGGQVS